MRKYKVGDVVVWMNMGHYNVSIISTVSPDGNGWSTDSAYKIFWTYNYEEAKQIQYILNGWGFAWKTIGNTQRDYIRAARDIINRHNFKRDPTAWDNKYSEMYAKANLTCFQEVLKKITAPEKVDALTKLWLAKYRFSKGELTEDEYNLVEKELKQIIIKN